MEERTLHDRLDDVRKGLSELATAVEDSWAEAYERIDYYLTEIEGMLNR